MPLYICNTKKGAIDDAAKPKIASDITDIHCEVTGAPPTFVHVFFFEEAPQPPLSNKTAIVFGTIRGGRTDDQKAQMVDRMRNAVHTHANIPLDDVVALTTDTPASWVMEGGDILPEPGEEAAWLAAHQAKIDAANAD